MDQAQKFIDTLKRIGFPDVLTLGSATDLEWMFADDSSAIFLNWFCEHVGSANVVDDTQQKAFEDLKAQGLVLDGPTLQKALKSSALTIDDPVPSESNLPQYIADLESTSAKLDMSQKRLARVSSDLSIQTLALQSRLEHLRVIEASALTDLRSKMQLCEQEHMKLQETLFALNAAMTDLRRLFEKNQSTGTLSSNSSLSHIDLQPFFVEEERYTTALAGFTEKRFFEGLSDIAAAHEEGYYQLLNITDPKMLAVRGESEETLLENCRELIRLQRIHPLSLKQNIDAKVNHAKVEAGSEALQTAIVNLTSYSQLTAQQLSNQLERVKGKWAICKRELAAADEELSKLIEQSTLLKEAYILTGDYNLKIARQQYFLECQNQVIDKLVEQRARNEVLSMMFDAEAEEVRQMKVTFCAVSSYLQALLHSSTQRRKYLEDAKIISSRYDRSVVDSRDVLLTTAAMLLEDDVSPTRMFFTYQELAQNAQSLVAQHAASAQPDAKLLEDHVTKMQALIKKCVHELCPQGLTPSASLTPRAVLEDISKLQELLGTVEDEIKALLKTVEQKKKLLQTK